MKKSLAVIFLLLSIASFAGEKLVASWDFTSGSLTDTVKGITLTPRGACTIVKGTGLLPGKLHEDKPCGAATEEAPAELAPMAFRIVMEFAMDEAATEGHPENYLWDNKYLNYKHKQDRPEYNKGILLELVRTGMNTYRPQACLGYGTASENVNGAVFTAEPNQRITLAFEYDGLGNATFTVNGKATKAHPLPIGGFVSPPFYKTVIGDRVMSTYHPFQGTIFSAKLFAIDIPPVAMEFPSRKAFRRGEQDASLQLRLKTTGIVELKNAKIAVQGKDGIADAVRGVAFTDKEATLTIPIAHTNLLPGTYPCTCTLTADTDNGPIAFTESIDLRIGPQLNPDDQIRFFWLLGVPYYEQTRDMGITHGLIGSGGYTVSTNSFSPDANAYRLAMMDKMLADGMTFLESCGFAHNRLLRQKYPRTRRDGSKNDENMDVSLPEVYNLMREIAQKNADAIGQHPACGGLLPASEIRDRSHPSFTEHHAKAFKEATGLEIPAGVEGRMAPPYSRIKDFPLGRIVPMEFPLLQYYTWFWKTGDGWNRFQSAVSDIFHETIKHPIFSFYDPSVRVPPLYGSGGSVDYLNQWTYIYPQPFNVSYVVSEQQAMARGRKGQGVITMLQGISYRSVLAPKEQKVENPPAWLADRPNTVYMTTPPDVMREGLWAIFSRKLEGIGLYAWRALFDASPYGYDKLTSPYQCTNTETVKVAAELFKRIAIPFGPLLKSIPERAPEVAVLESYASTFFAGRGTWGWHGHIYEVGTMLTGANFSPYVLYEEEAANGIPDSIKVIIAPQCDVLTQPAYEALCKFQARGGLLVADEYLSPALMADFTLPPFESTQKAEADKRAMQDAAAKLQSMLAPYYLSYSNTDNADIFTHVRSYKDADYLFVINDKRTFGDYVGQYGRLMEKGLPNSGHVTVRRTVGAVYDLEHHRAVPFTTAEGTTTIETSFDTNDGKLLLLASKPLGKLALTLPDKAAPAESFTLTVSSPDTDLLIPIDLHITLPNGVRLDNSGPGILKDGQFTRTVSIPENIPQGPITIKVTNLADGSVITRQLN